MTEQDATPDPLWGRRQYACDVVVRAPYAGHKTCDWLKELSKQLQQRGIIWLIAAVGSDFADTYSDNSTPFPEFHIFSPGIDMGAVRAANIGLWLSYLTPAPFVMFLDDDARIPEGDDTWLERMLAYFDKDPLCGVVGATTSEEGATQDILALPPVYTEAWSQPGAGRQGHTGDLATSSLHNFACIWRKEALRKVHEPDFLFDERFEPGILEDVDMCIRLRMAGYTCVVAQDVHVHHEGRATYKQYTDADRLRRQNAVKLLAKYGPKNLKKLGIEIDPDE